MDPVIQEVLTFWEQKCRPDYEACKQLSPPALALLWQWDLLVENSGVLYRLVFQPDGKEAVLQVVLPNVLKEQVLTEVHQRHGHQDPRAVMSTLLLASYVHRCGTMVLQV